METIFNIAIQDHKSKKKHDAKKRAHVVCNHTSDLLQSFIIL